MRVIDHRQFKRTNRRHRSWRRFALLLLVVVAASGGLYLWQQRLPKVSAPSASDAGDQLASQPPEHTPKTYESLKTFDGGAFKQLYKDFRYPNIQPVTTTPSITGNPAADERIVAIATGRGYKLNSVPVLPLVAIGEPYLTNNDQLQPLAQAGWKALSKAAQAAGVDLEVTSGYRSIEDQRAIFKSRLQALTSVSAVAAGQADNAVESVLLRAAIPGYSRHHTGYVIDFACGGVGLEGFLQTPCYRWLSQNNYKNAKTHGFIPSYPEATERQGPEPEPWEYAWVGRDVLYE